MIRLAFVLSLVAGCQAKNPCVSSAPSEIELRDGTGELVLAARPGADGGLDLCDANQLRLGTARVASSTVKLVDRGGAERLTLSADSKVAARGVRGGQPRLRVYREGHETHVLQPDGVR